ncbi:MAG: response regulator [Polyangiaceae bacterium]
MSASSRPKKKNGRILVVDDEPTVARATARAISRDYDVVIENDPARAKDRLLSSEGFDLVLCDLTMPVLSGQELYAAIMRERPELASKFVFVTGGTFTPAARVFLASVKNPCLMKPFSIESLREIVRGIIPSAKI